MDNISAILIVLYWLMIVAGGFLFKGILELGREIRELRIKILGDKEDLGKLKKSHENFAASTWARVTGVESYLRGQSIKASELQSEISKHPNDKVLYILINPGYFRYDDLRQIEDKYEVFEIDSLEKDFIVVYTEAD